MIRSDKPNSKRQVFILTSSITKYCNNVQMRDFHHWLCLVFIKLSVAHNKIEKVFIVLPGQVKGGEGAGRISGGIFLNEF